MSLMDIYLQLGGMDAADQEVVAEQVKEAAQQDEAATETVKMAHDYDAAGRRLARALWGQHKLAGLGFPGKEEDEGKGKEREAEREGSENKPKAKKAPMEREDEGGGDEKKRKDEGDGEEQEGMAEKKASILARAAEDPEFAAKLLAWHQDS